MIYTITQEQVCQIAAVCERLRDLLASINIANTVMLCREDIRKAVEEYKGFEKALIFKKGK